MSSLPHPISTPSWWQLATWVLDPLGSQERYRAQYGDLFTVQLGGLKPYVIISNPKMIQEIFSQDAKFDVGRGNALAEPLVGKHSLMLLDGDRHQRERKLLMPPFHGERLHTYAQQICEITTTVADQWQPGQSLIMRREMQKISLDVILNVVFGLSSGDRYQQLKPLLTQWIERIDSPLRSSQLFFRFLQQDLGKWSPWGQVKEGQRQVHAVLAAEIAERRSQDWASRTDVLSLMMAARDEQGQAMTDDELRDELLTILFAGHETTATTLAWAFYQVHRHPQVRARLLQELQSLGESASPMAIAQLPYLTAVCQETLRMYPVLPVLFPRITRSPMTIGGYDFPAETVLMPTIYLVHYREDIYPQPHQFQPERFLERQYSPFEYFPFGGGVRRCLGYALALLEMKLVLATILAKYPLTLTESAPVPMQRRGFTLAPQGGIHMTAG